MARISQKESSAVTKTKKQHSKKNSVSKQPPSKLVSKKPKPSITKQKVRVMPTKTLKAPTKSSVSKAKATISKKAPAKVKRASVKPTKSKNVSKLLQSQPDESEDCDMDTGANKTAVTPIKRKKASRRKSSLVESTDKSPDLTWFMRRPIRGGTRLLKDGKDREVFLYRANILRAGKGIMGAASHAVDLTCKRLTRHLYAAIMPKILTMAINGGIIPKHKAGQEAAIRITDHHVDVALRSLDTPCVSIQM